MQVRGKPDARKGVGTVKQVRGKLDARKGAEIEMPARRCGTGDGRGRHFRARPPPPPA